LTPLSGQLKLPRTYGRTRESQKAAAKLSIERYSQAVKILEPNPEMEKSDENLEYE
jgi:hypothetical protein